MWVQYLLSVIHPEQQQDRLHLCSGHTRNQIARLAGEHLGHPEGWMAWIEVLSDNDITKQNFDFYKCNDIHSIYMYDVNIWNSCIWTMGWNNLSEKMILTVLKATSAVATEEGLKNSGPPRPEFFRPFSCCCRSSVHNCEDPLHSDLIYLFFTP